MTYHNLNCTGNSGSALRIIESTASFHDVRVADSVGRFGAGMQAHHSSVFFSGSTVFEGNAVAAERGAAGGAISVALNTNLSFNGVSAFISNRAVYGGAIEGIIDAEISISGYCLSLNNIAAYGGSIFASQTNVILSDLVNFTSNRAQSGGAMHFINGATLTFKQNVTVTSSNNHASTYGGFIMHSESITTSQCYFINGGEKLSQLLSLPICFIQFEGLNLVTITTPSIQYIQLMTQQVLMGVLFMEG